MIYKNGASLILCAGESSRMGKVKALLKWQDKTLLQYAVNAAREAGLGRVLTVLGAHTVELSKETTLLEVDAIHHADWAKGMGSSIKVGLFQLQANFPDLEFVIIQLADQPLVTAHTLERLLVAHTENPLKVIAAEYNSSVGVPVLFPRSFFPALSVLADEAGAKKLILRHWKEVIPLSLPEAAHDIDTPEQYEKLLLFNV